MGTGILVARLAAVCVAALSLLAGCVTGADMQHLRESEAEGARTGALLHCALAYQLPASNSAVKECARGLAPLLYDQAVSEDNASMRRDYYVPPVVEVTPYQPPTLDLPPVADIPPVPPSPVPNLGSMYSPQPAPPPVQYVPVAPGDPLNAGLNANGYPTR